MVLCLIKKSSLSASVHVASNVWLASTVGGSMVRVGVSGRVGMMTPSLSSDTPPSVVVTLHWYIQGPLPSLNVNVHVEGS